MGYDVGGTPNEMVVDVSTVYVSGKHIGIFIAEDFCRQLFAYLVSLFG